MISSRLHDTDALILCGGLGTRLRSVVPDRPKPLAEVNGRPFLDILLDHVFAQGIRRAVLCVGYQKEQIIDHITAERSKHPAWGEIVFSTEESPLGTGGAVKHAESHIQSEQVFVLNGDTFARVPLAELHDFHREQGSVITIAAAPVPGRADVGSLDVDDKKRITGFRERAAERTGVASAGTYLLSREAFKAMPAGAFSIEQDFFPRIVAEQPCFAYLTSADVLDIGTPERYDRAHKLLA